MNTRNAGFTIVEALVALSILVIAMSVMIPFFISNMQLNSRSDARTQAATIAQRVLDSYRLKNPAGTEIPRSGSLRADMTDGAGRRWPYTVTFCPTPAFCGESSRGLRVDVMQANQVVYTAETVFTQLYFELDNAK